MKKKKPEITHLFGFIETKHYQDDSPINFGVVFEKTPFVTINNLPFHKTHYEMLEKEGFVSIDIRETNTTLCIHDIKLDSFKVKEINNKLPKHVFYIAIGEIRL